VSLLIGDIQPGSWEDLFAGIAAIQTWAGKVEGVNAQLTTGLAGLQGVPTGAGSLWYTNTAPAGWLLCDGSLVSRTTYASLFAVIGVTYGVGNGSTTFTLPDLRQRFPLGKAATGTGNALAATGGAINHTHAGGSLVASHDHGGATALATSGTEQVQSGTGAFVGSDNSHDHTISTDAAAVTGTSGSGNPPYQVVNFIIKA